MASRKSTALKVSVSNSAEDLAAKFARGIAPWAAWLAGEPLAAALFTALAAGTGRRVLVSTLLWAACGTLTWVTWRVSHARGHGRVHHAVNAFAALAWPAAVTGYGWLAWRGVLLITWAVLGLLLCLIWNIRYSSHADPVEDVLQVPRGRAAKRVDAAYVVRVLAGRAPWIRVLAEKGHKVVPVLAAPWRETPRGALDVPGAAKAITAGPSPDHADAAAVSNAQKAAQSILKNFRDFTARKVTDLNGARMKLLTVQPWRISTEVVLLRGVHTPKHLIDVRELLASQNAMPLSSVLIRPNPRDNHRTFVDFVIEDVLAAPRHWPGPAAAGQSIAGAPVRYGLYEDRAYAESWETAITDEMARRLGVPEQNLSHILSEGMTGAGKSTCVRIVIADGSTRLDVEDWALDPVKKYQTLGCVAEALAWFATDVAECKALIRFLALRVIPERANYLGMHGYDNWEPGCGLPFLRVTIEEGGIIANELDDLDKVLNSARSAGVKIRASFQRAHHAVVDTNVRAAFGESLSFGVKDIADAFAVPDELLHAGADPSLWQDRQPGMHYRSAAGIPFDRQLMPVRSFNVDQGTCRDITGKHAPARDAWIAENCPDWAAMLEDLDANGVYAGRTTGAMVLEKIDAAAQRKAARAAGRARPQAAPAGDGDEDDEPLAEVRDIRPRQPERLAEEDEIFEGEIVDEMEPVSMDELDLDPELAEGAEEDAGIDPRQPIRPVPGEADMAFPPRPEQPVLDRDEALGRLRAILRALGPGREFYPRDLYEEACEATGRRASWVRGELSTTLAAEGLVVADRGTGIYTVTDKAAA